MWSGRYVHDVKAWNNGRGLPVNNNFTLDKVPQTHQPNPTTIYYCTTVTLDKVLASAGYRILTLGKTDYLMNQTTACGGNHSIDCVVMAETRSAGVRYFRVQ